MTAPAISIDPAAIAAVIADTDQWNEDTIGVICDGYADAIITTVGLLDAIFGLEGAVNLTGLPAAHRRYIEVEADHDGESIAEGIRFALNVTREGSIVRYTVALLGLDWDFLRPEDGGVASIVEKLVATIVAELNKQLAGLAMLWASASTPSIAD